MSLALQLAPGSLGGHQMPEASGSRQNASEGPSQARDGGGHWWEDQGRMDMKHRQTERGWMLNRTEDWKQISKCMNKK